MSATPPSAEHPDPRWELKPEEFTFLKTQTGIDDETELKDHIMRVQKKGYAAYPSPYMQLFGFTKLTITSLPAYKYVLELGKTRKNALFLDIGCGFGQATRKVIADGFPAQNVIALDNRQDFWDFGHELFCSTPESFPVIFVIGDIFDDAMFAPSEPTYEIPSEALAASDLKSLTSLTPLRGRLSVIYAGAFFHLFDEENQENAARRLASLLSPEPGSVVFGGHVATSTKGVVPTPTGPGVFCHSPESWKELWDGKIFRKNTIKVECGLEELGVVTYTGTWRMMWWSVTRL